MNCSMNRRRFLRASATTLAAVAGGARLIPNLFANPLGLPVGLELYTVRHEMEKDFEGTLAQAAAIGYKEVEISATGARTAAEIKRVVSANGLAAPAAHFSFGQVKSGWDRQIEYAKTIGTRYLVCAFLEPAERKSLDDYKRVAEAFNKAGEQCQNAGLQFAYHNHNFEFTTFDGALAYDELLRAADPKLVQMELDCYWMTRAGYDPVEYFRKHPGRFPLLHIKDMKAGQTPTTDVRAGGNAFTEVGRGSIDWKRIFAAANGGGLKHYFVEQDVCERPPLESAQISYEYLRNL